MRLPAQLAGHYIPFLRLVELRRQRSFELMVH
jgi:hypothetical protein